MLEPAIRNCGGSKLTIVNGIEEVGTLLGFINIGVNQERVGLGVYVLHHDLESIKATSFGDLNFAAESLNQVLIDNAIGGREESQHAGHEVTFVVVQAVIPVVQILRKINFLGGPERRLGFLVHLPDLSRKNKCIRFDRTRREEEKKPLYARRV